jgi:hypothetical protein
MPYGIHWEWRGFGTIEPDLRKRISQLPLAYPTARKVTDRYLWTPALTTNIKLRLWRDGASLKFKRSCDEHSAHGAELWAESLAEDFIFPLTPDVVALLSEELGVDLGQPRNLADPKALLHEVGAAGVRVVTVEKTRWLHQWQEGAFRTFVEAARITSPHHVHTVGIEDHMGLDAVSSRQAIDSALQAVVRARESLSLPGNLQSQSYLSAIAKWARQ